MLNEEKKNLRVLWLVFEMTQPTITTGIIALKDLMLQYWELD